MFKACSSLFSVNRCQVLSSLLALTCASLVLISNASGETADTTSVEITTYNSPYMNARDTQLGAVGNGAMVGADTKAYWDIEKDSPERASYDDEIIVEVADGVWTIGTSGLVNSHIVAAPEGLIIYDTGENDADGMTFYRLMRTVTDLPVKAIIYSHEHYCSGTKVMVDEEAKRGNVDIMILGHPATNDEMARTGGLSSIHPEMGGILMARAVEQFNFYLPKEGPDSGFKNTLVPGASGFVPVNTPVEHGQTLSVAGLEMVFYTEGIATDTNNQVMVWVPSRKLVMNNVVWGWFPNIYSARGGRYRSPEQWIEAVDNIRALKPEILLSSHHSTIAGAELIMERLNHYRDSLAYVLDQTLKGILQGQGPTELRYSVKLPEHLETSPSLIQNYGEVSIMTPRIYKAIFGQFDRNAANLNKLHPVEEARRMVQAMGGYDKTYKLTKKAYDDGDYLWAGQLSNYLLTAKDTPKHRQIKADCLRAMGYRALSTNSRSWYLSQALALEGKAHIVTAFPATPASVDNMTADYVNYYRIRISPERAKKTNAVLGLRFGNETFGLHIRQGVVQFIPDVSDYSQPADVTVSMNTEVWTQIFNNVADPATLIDDHTITVEDGGAATAKALFALFDIIYDWENDQALKELPAKLEMH